MEKIKIKTSFEEIITADPDLSNFAIEVDGERISFGIEAALIIAKVAAEVALYKLEKAEDLKCKMSNLLKD